VGRNYAYVAQLVEHRCEVPGVVGSNPTVCTNTLAYKNVDNGNDIEISATNRTNNSVWESLVNPHIATQSINKFMENLEQYKNKDGTYTSPKNGKVFKSVKALRAHMSYKGTTCTNTFKKRLFKVNCEHCEKEYGISNIKIHTTNCYLNPINMILCKICNNPIKNYRTSKGTCSRSCANTYFRTGSNHGNWSTDRYRSTCWEYHKKECIVCGENKIVAVHHNDHNHNNNDLMNLIPLCPTHHQYVHSRYRDEVQPIIDEYIRGLAQYGQSVPFGAEKS
jgi:hypothetical protein